MDVLVETSSERVSLRELVCLAETCANEVQPVLVDWKRSIHYRTAIRSALHYIERVAGDLEAPAKTHSKTSGPIGIATLDIAAKKAHAPKAHHIGHALA